MTGKSTVESPQCTRCTCAAFFSGSCCARLIEWRRVSTAFVAGWELGTDIIDHRSSGEFMRWGSVHRKKQCSSKVFPWLRPSGCVSIKWRIERSAKERNAVIFRQRHIQTNEQTTREQSKRPTRLEVRSKLTIPLDFNNGYSSAAQFPRQVMPRFSWDCVWDALLVPPFSNASWWADTWRPFRLYTVAPTHSNSMVPTSSCLVRWSNHKHPLKSQSRLLPHTHLVPRERLGSWATRVSWPRSSCISSSLTIKLVNDACQYDVIKL